MGSGGGSTDTGGGPGGSAGGYACAMMLCASMKAFFCASRAFFVFSAVALPAATRFGFFCRVAGIFEVTCSSTGRCVSSIYLLNKFYLIEQCSPIAEQCSPIIQQLVLHLAQQADSLLNHEKDEAVAVLLAKNRHVLL